MNLTISLDEKQAAHLQRVASSRHLSLEQFARDLLGDALDRIVDKADLQPAADDAAEKWRQEALERFQARADASRFLSAGPYPTRDELHERR